MPSCDNGRTECIDAWGTVSYEIAPQAGDLPGDPLLWIGGGIAAAVALFFFRMGRPDRSLTIGLCVFFGAALSTVAAVLNGTSSDPGSLPAIALDSHEGAVVVNEPAAMLLNATDEVIEVTRVLPNFSKNVVLKRPQQRPDCLRHRLLPQGDKCYVAFTVSPEK